MGGLTDATTAQNAVRDVAIAMVCDAAFLPYASYLAAALDRQSPGRDFDLVILGPGLPSLPSGLPEIRLRRFDRANPFEHRSLRKRRSHASYLCLMLPELLPEYRRILYLDCDVLPNGPVSEVLSADLHGQALGGVRDAQQWRTPGRSPAEFSRLGLPAERYMNSGVLLFDTERWKAERWTDACIDAAADPELAKGYVRNDQSALNLALRGRWTELSPVWNWQWTEFDALLRRRCGRAPDPFHRPEEAMEDAGAAASVLGGLRAISPTVFS